MNKNVIDRVNDLRLTSKSRIDKIQMECSPFLANKFIRFEEVFRYVQNGLETPVQGYEFRCIKTNGLRFIYTPAKKQKYSRRDYLETLVKDAIIYPFLLFNHGKVIKWSDIEVLRDYDYTYIMIHNQDTNDLDLDIIEFPCEVRYGEDDNVLSRSECSASMYFDDDGYITVGDNIACRLEVIDDSIYSQVDTIDSNHDNFRVNIKNGQLVGLHCIIPFNANGELVSSEYENMTHYGYNTYRTTSTYMKYYSFYYKYGNPSSNLAYKDTIDQEHMHELVLNGEDDKLVTKIKELFDDSFDFEYDREKTFEENIMDSLKYIMSYNPNLMDATYKKETNVIVEHYTGQYFHNRINSSKDKEFVRFARKRGNDLDNYVLLFVNGELYKYNDSIRYENNTIAIPVNGIYQEDDIEMVIFTDVCNTIADIIISKDEPKILRYNTDYLKLYTTEPHNTAYQRVIEPLQNDALQLELEYSVTKIKNNIYNIELVDDYYYDKSIMCASDRQFRHVMYNHYTFEEGDYYFLLPPSFNYCHDKDRYAVFINGTMVSKQNFSVTITSDQRPFDKLYLYITTTVNEDDRVDVYYVPDSLKDAMWLDNMELSGDIVVDASELTTPLSKENYFFFVNGLKVSDDQIRNISRNRVRITTDLGSINNILIVKYTRDIDTLAELFSEITTDKWSEFLSEFDETELSGIENIDFANKPEDANISYMDDHNPLSSIVSDIVVDYYMRRAGLNLTNKTFVYDFELEAQTEGDEQSGVSTLTTTNASYNDKIHQYLINQTDEFVATQELYKSPVDSETSN